MARSSKKFHLPEPDFTDSAELRLYLNENRSLFRAAAMHLHMSAGEIQAALTEIRPSGEGGLLARSMAKAGARRRARRVARHMHHAAECLMTASVANVRCWAAFRAEYAPELSPVRGKRGRFTVVSE